MKPQTFIIPSLAGQLEVTALEPDTPRRGIALVGHPHPLFGGTNQNKVAQTLMRSFAKLGYWALCPNFRGVGASSGCHDEGKGEVEDMLTLATYAQTQVGELPIALAGFSFGAYIQAQVSLRLAHQGLVLVGPAVTRFPMPNVGADTLVIHGEADDVVPLVDVMNWARPQELPVTVFPAAGHFFHGRLHQLQAVVRRYWGL